MKILVIGSHSFLQRGVTVGCQALAMALADQGCAVSYLSAPTTPMDFLLPSMRYRASARKSEREVEFTETPLLNNVKELIISAPYPCHRMFCPVESSLRFWENHLSGQLADLDFDVCISDVVPSIVLMRSIKSRIKVARLNDWPRGFGWSLPPSIHKRIETDISSGLFSLVLPVSGVLAQYARDLNTSTKIKIIPSGAFFSNSSLPTRRLRNSAIFVGSNEPWVDFALLAKVAQLMPSWTFGIYCSALPRQVRDLPNVEYFGTASLMELQSKLERFEVGVLPYRDYKGRLRYVERPLKFYQYMGAGLGIASTDQGGLRTGLSEYAAFGNDPRTFRDAILRAQSRVLDCHHSDIQTFRVLNSWETRAKECIELFRELL
jgi:hypothetical protein